ncbi:MAG TPA: hypothetical protein VJY41_12215, partial [Prolixibacteraceae bacterium]|nr:hypothetical protein [Prolixibacteraceae bacterium]
HPYTSCTSYILHRRPSWLSLRLQPHFTTQSPDEISHPPIPTHSRTKGVPTLLKFPHPQRT